MIRAVPTIYEEDGYAFRFWSSDRDEPPHVHVEGRGGHAKFWLDPPGIAKARGYNAREVRRIHDIINEHRDEFLDRWNDFFS